VTTPDETPPARWPNGVEVHTTKTVFYPVQGAVRPVACTGCGYRMALEDPATGEPTACWEPFSDALDRWWAGESAAVTCPRCQQASGLNDWHWQGDWPIAVGFLGFSFWNWPALSQSFISQIGTRLGHRVVVTQGKL